jgi:hypothetical protein
MIALAVALAVGYLVWLTPQCWVRLDRYLEILVRRIPAPEVEAQASEPIPADLLVQAREAYVEKWAQESAIEALYDSYGKLGSWDNVRVAVRAGGF